MTLDKFVPSPYTTTKGEGKVSWKAPSNIALVKYWGQKGRSDSSEPFNQLYTKHQLYKNKHTVYSLGA